MEEPVQFQNGNEWLRGVLHLPDGHSSPSLAVVLLHGWSGCRLGPHRMFVTTARRLCRQGFACLRFDFRGRGESDGATRQATIRSMISDAECAVEMLRSRLKAPTVLLLGICSGGKVAVGVTTRNEHVAGLVLWSAEAMGPLRSTAGGTRKSLAAIRAYARKLTQPATWRKLLSFQFDARLVGKALVGHETAGPEERRDETAMLERFRGYTGPVLFIYGSHDPETRSAAENYERFCRRAGIESEFHSVPEANHSFYSTASERQVLDLTDGWLTSRFAGAAAPGTGAPGNP